MGLNRREALRGGAVVAMYLALGGLVPSEERKTPFKQTDTLRYPAKDLSQTTPVTRIDTNTPARVLETIQHKASEFPQSITEFANRRTVEDIANFIKNIHSAQTAEAAPVPDSGGGMYEVTPDGGIYVTRTNGGKGPDWGYHWNGPLLEAYNKTGGFPNWGSPIARPYKDELNRIVGWTERGGFQAHTEGGRLANVEWYNTFDRASEMDKDAWLQSVRQTPPPAKYPEEEGMSWEEIVRNRLKILDQNPAIKAKYMGNGNDQFWLEKNGLPTAYKDEGNHYALRAQRAVYQQWKEDVPWAKKGEVTIALGGSIAKELGIIPDGALALQARTEVFGSPVALENKEAKPFPDLQIGSNGSTIYNLSKRYGIKPSPGGFVDANGNFCPDAGANLPCDGKRNVMGLEQDNLDYLRKVFDKYSDGMQFNISVADNPSSDFPLNGDYPSYGFYGKSDGKNMDIYFWLKPSFESLDWQSKLNIGQNVISKIHSFLLMHRFVSRQVLEDAILRNKYPPMLPYPRDMTVELSIGAPTKLLLASAK